MVHFVKKANYVSLFAMDLEKLLVNDKIKALRQTNMSPKDYIKYLKKNKKTKMNFKKMLG